MRLPAPLRLLASSLTASLFLLPACGGGGVLGDGGDDDVPDVDGSPPSDGGGTDTGGDGGDDGGDGGDGGMPPPDAPPDANTLLSVCATGADYATIGAAVAAAPAGARITICAGTYAERLTIAKSLTLEGAGASSTTLDAGLAGSAIDVTAGTLTISGLTIQRGRSATQGGGIKCTNAGLAMTASRFTDNRAEGGGGGLGGSACTVALDGVRFDDNEGVDAGGAIYLVNSTGTIANGEFVANSADYGGAVNLSEGDVDIRTSRFTTNHSRIRGGGLYQSSSSAVEHSVFDQNTSGWTGAAVHVNQHAPTFHASQFTNNRAEWEGGGFYLHQTQAVLTDNTISHNRAFDDGAGLRIFESRARLERNVISNNVSEDGDGGAFKNSHVPSTFIDNMILDNWALGAGGGMELDNCASTVRGGVISGNHASIGGGIHVMLWPYNGGVIEDVRIVGNDAHRGGGIYLENSWTLNTIRRVVISGNEANYGGGVYTRGTPLRMSNSIVTGNDAGVVGGGFYVHSSYAYPWTRACPCPPIDPAAEVNFTVVHGNTADDGAAAVWVNAPNIVFRNSIFSGHTGNAVTVAEHTVPPPPMSPPDTMPTVVQTPAPGWYYNDTYPATFAGMSDPTGNDGNIARDPAFVNPAEQDFRLQAGSPCIDAAEPAMADLDGTRADQGFYGGPGAPVSGN